MIAKAREILPDIALCLTGGLLAMYSISISSAGDIEILKDNNFLAASASVDRFASNTNYCKAFTAAQGVGTDGVSADFSVALSDAIRANGGNIKRTFSMIREKCSVVA
jgi:hypothetical protein